MSLICMNREQEGFAFRVHSCASLGDTCMFFVNKDAECQQGSAVWTRGLGLGCV